MNKLHYLIGFHCVNIILQKIKYLYKSYVQVSFAILRGYAPEKFQTAITKTGIQGLI